MGELSVVTIALGIMLGAVGIVLVVVGLCVLVCLYQWARDTVFDWLRRI